MAPLLSALGAAEGLSRYVGGAVRDQLAGLPVSDVDLATRLEPHDVQRRLQHAGIKSVPTGIEHGTITAVSAGQVVEVTTLRRDISTDGRRATVAFTDDWREDAARRDFTINALFADPLTGEIIDYFNGLADLKAGQIRFIGDPLQRIAEDHLRILRFFRFQARFGKSAPDPEALQACVARANDLMALSRERIADELLKLLALPHPADTVRLMVERGIFRPMLPELDSSSPIRLERLIAAENESSITADPLRRLSAMLPPDPAVAEKVAVRLKLSNKARKRLASAVPAARSGDPRELAFRLGTQAAVDRLLLAGRSEDARRVAQWTVPRLPIGGGDLIQRGVAQGPAVARTLRRIEDAWIAAGFPEGDRLEPLIADALQSNSEC
jgi:poly(A) polymerase